MRASLKIGTTRHLDVNHSTATNRSFTRQCTSGMVTAPLRNQRIYAKAGLKLKGGVEACR